MNHRVSLPYFDQVFAELDNGAPDYAEAWGRHAHWGYWPDPRRADGSMGDYVRAADEFSRRHFAPAGLRDGSAVLDVGCGFGGTLGLINDEYAGTELTGVNIDARQLARANQLIAPQARKGNRLRFVEADATELPFPDGSFDAVLALECIFHFPSRRRFLAQAARVLRPGGRLVVSDFVPIWPAVPLFWAGSLAMRKEIRETTGAYSLPLDRRSYDWLARRAGLQPRTPVDITHQTLPSAPIFHQLLSHRGEFAERMAKVYVRMANLMRAGLMRYLIMSWEKPAP